jgi:hypothetical protein
MLQLSRKGIQRGEAATKLEQEFTEKTERFHTKFFLSALSYLLIGIFLNPRV